VLPTYGVKVGTIERIARHGLSVDAADTNTALFGQIPKLASQCQLELLESSQLEAFCSTLFCDLFSDHYYPLNTNYPDRQLTTQAIFKFMNDPEFDEIDESKPRRCRQTRLCISECLLLFSWGDLYSRLLKEKLVLLLSV
jgi:hypothetical protein